MLQIFSCDHPVRPVMLVLGGATVSGCWLLLLGNRNNIGGGRQLIHSQMQGWIQEQLLCSSNL